MWIDRTKKHTISFKADDYEREIIRGLKETGKCSQAEVIRNALWTIRIVFDGDLKLKDIVKEQNWDKPLGDIILPIPVLANKIDLDLKLWKLIMNED